MEFGEGIIDHFTKLVCVAFRGLKMFLSNLQ